MIDINIMKQYIGTGLKCHLIGEHEADYPDHAAPKAFTLAGVRQRSNGTIMCQFEEDPILIWKIEYVYPILHPLSDLTSTIGEPGSEWVPAECLWGGSIDDLNKFDIDGVIPVHWEHNIGAIKDKQISYFDSIKLFEWHFDLDGLIDSKDAVDTNSLIKH